jgi:hypothetical protein
MNQCYDCKNNKQIVNNDSYMKLSFKDALWYYERGKTIECRILNNNGEIIDWEKYNICEGLNIALEFNEILNGQWYLVGKNIIM